MNYTDVAEKRTGLEKSDSEFRDRLVQNGRLGDGSNKGTAKLHNRNAETLEEIIDTIGYPVIDEAGNEASEAPRLIIHRSIEPPDFMKSAWRYQELLFVQTKRPLNTSLT